MKILPNQFKQAEYHRNAWSVVPEPGTALKDFTTADAWLHVSKSLKARDQIELMPEDGAWYALLIVRSNGEKGPVLGVLHYVAFGADTKAVDDSAAFYVKFAGSDKWRVLRKSDNAVLAKGMATREEAEAWIEEHNTALA